VLCDVQQLPGRRLYGDLLVQHGHLHFCSGPHPVIHHWCCWILHAGVKESMRTRTTDLNPLDEPLRDFLVQSVNILGFNVSTGHDTRRAWGRVRDYLQAHTKKAQLVSGSGTAAAGVPGLSTAWQDPRSHP
jgi:hypothetical protein